MGQVVGIGGVFIKAKDPAAMRTWYRTHLGMDVQTWGGVAFDWNRPDGPGTSGVTAWRLFDEGSTHFGPGAQRVMVNYIVTDLHGLLAALRGAGCEVAEKSQDSEYGKFGWVVDPEGNRLELWEPPPASADAEKAA